MASREIQVTREQVITPTGVTYNDYEDMFVSVTEGDSIKVTKKHKDVQETILHALDDGRAVKLSYAEYMNKEYVAKAEYFDGKPSEHKSNAPETIRRPENTQTGTKTQTNGKNDGFNGGRGYALRYAVDIAVAKVTAGKDTTPKETLDTADQFLAWLNK